MTIGNKIIAAIENGALYYEKEPEKHLIVGFTFRPKIAAQIDALVAAHVEEQVRLRLEDSLGLIEGCARQSCHTGRASGDYRGQVADTFVTDSGAISTNAEVLRFLASLTPERFRIVSEGGRMVVGYWPENDPAKKSNTF